MDIKKTITLFLLSSVCLHASPHKMKTQKGSATLSQEEAHTTIRCSDKTILHWDSFSIGEKEKVEFVQPHKDAAVLNRVTGSDKSQILGQLCANGNLFLVNPNGLVIGPNAKIVTTTFIASTLDILDEDFLGGKEIFFSGQSDKTIENRGFVKGRDGAIFIARSIKNSGNIEAKETSLIGAGSVLYKPHAHQKFYLQVDTLEEGEVENSGYIKALSTQILANGAYEKAIHHTGTLEAYDLKEENGTVTIIAKEGENYIDGEITAANGDISLLGEKVTLSDNAQINASGKNPGAILIGGDFQGKNPDIQNAKKTYVGTSASIKADSLDDNDGGRIIVWSDEYIFYDGHISARGGPNGGDGGFVEISGKKGGHVSLDADLKAPKGKAGQLLLDPKNVQFVNTGGVAIPGSGLIDWDDSGAGATIDLDVADVATFLSGDTADLTIRANNDITRVSGASISSTSSRNLTLNAGESITLTGLTISLTGGDFTATINDEGATNGQQDGNAPIFTGASISTNGGNISITHGNQNGTSEGKITTGVMDAGGGNITIDGVGLGSVAASRIGVEVSGAISTSGSGTISITGNSTTEATNNAIGVDIADNITSENGNMTIIGTSQGGSGQAGGTGVDVGSTISTGSGTGVISITGTGSSSGTTNCHGVRIVGAIFVSNQNIEIEGTGGGASASHGVLYNGGDISSHTVDITGRAAGSGTGKSGILFDQIFFSSGGTIIADGTGSSSATDNNLGIDFLNFSLLGSDINLDLTGQGGGTGSNNYGIDATNGGAGLVAGTGSVSLNGTGGGGASGTGNRGVVVDNAPISSSASSITITGTGGSGTTDNRGVYISGSSAQVEVTAGSGNMSVTGTGGGSGSDNEGVFIQNDAQARVSGTGTLSVTGAPGGSETDAILVQVGARINGAGASSGDITVNTTSGDCHINNDGAILSASTTASINCDIARDLLLSGGASGNARISISDPGASGDILALAGRNVTFTTSTNEGQVTNTGNGNVTLVCDNLFPNFPDVGTGAFSFSSTISGNNEVRIYTADRSFNTVSDPINGQVFTPGTFGVDSTNEKWSVYFPDGDYDMGAAFTFYYKVPLPETPTIVTTTALDEVTLNQLQIAQSQMTDFFPLWRNKYIVTFCRKNKCLLNPYDYFVYWPYRWNL